MRENIITIIRENLHEAATEGALSLSTSPVAVVIVVLIKVVEKCYHMVRVKFNRSKKCIMCAGPGERRPTVCCEAEGSRLTLDNSARSATERNGSSRSIFLTS